MDEGRMAELAKEALADSRRNDCEFVGVRVVGAGVWRIELMDVMLKREPFAVSVRADAGMPDSEIKDAIRRAVAEHYSIDSY
ncbi:MAG: hypothetical protein M3268_03860 [Acidobacteriota bacterium]|nr:hypothetical protein [Acidobacteriota bacterium]